MFNLSKISSLKDLFNKEIIIDLGSSNTVVGVKNKGVVLVEPTCIAMNSKTKEVIAVGHEAKEMIGKTPPNINAFYPVQHGVICDFEGCELFVKNLFSKMSTSNFLFDKFAFSKVIISTPSNISEVEQRAIYKIMKNLGVRKVYIVPQLLLSALGHSIDITKSSGTLIVNIGGGCCEIGVVSISSIIVNNSIRTGSNKLDEQLVDYVKTRFGVVIGEKKAEEAKIAIAQVFETSEKPKKSEHFEIRGRSIKTALPEKIKLNNLDLSLAYKEPLHLIIDSIKRAIEDTPSELISDITQNKIHLSGGGALLNGFEDLLFESTKINTVLGEHAELTVAKGALKLLDNRELLNKISLR
ncbi:rod shape-determining protein [Patescibacteria group bacterium]|nr:rod shape-determining protein [Patescibacteria group bacterium]